MRILLLISFLASTAGANIHVAAHGGSGLPIIVKKSGVWYEVDRTLKAKEARAPVFSQVKLIRTGKEICAVLNTNEAVCWDSWENFIQDVNRRSLGKVPSDTAQFSGYCLRTASNQIHCLKSTLVNDEVKYGYFPVDTTGLEGKGTALSSSSTHACVLTDKGRAYCWGENYAGKLGIGGFPFLQKPEDDEDWSVGLATPGIPFPTSRVKGIETNVEISEVSVVHQTSCALSNEPHNNAYCWGRISPLDGTYAKFELFSRVTSPVAVRLDLGAVPGKYFELMTAVASGGLGLARENQVFWWGGFEDQEIRHNLSLKVNYLASLPRAETVLKLFPIGSEVCALTKTESLYCSRHGGLGERKTEFIRVTFR